MHSEILNDKQKELLPFSKKYIKNYYLVGGIYFDDIDYTEQIEFLPGFETDEKAIKDFLIDAALTGF